MTKETVSRTQELYNSINEGIDSFATPEGLKTFLTGAGSLYRYSFNNIMLILMECPEATEVMGYKSWLEAGRQVNKGEKAIYILGSRAYKFKKDEDATESDDAPVKKGRYYFPCKVFDISQTSPVEGAPAQNIPVTDTSRFAEWAATLDRSFIAKNGYSVDYAESPHAPGIQYLLPENAFLLRPNLAPHVELSLLVKAAVWSISPDSLEIVNCVSYVICNALDLPTPSDDLALPSDQDSQEALEEIGSLSSTILKALNP